VTDDPAAALAAERADALRQVDQLGRDLAEVMAASRDSNADDEHDPEGATIGFERAQLTSLLDAARRRVSDVELALEQVRTGGYGTCERCGGPIGAERLAARPSARTCIGCASARR
jgi:RNA polymerase-binding transcription factor DksA